MQTIDEALAPLTAMLAAEDFQLEVMAGGGGSVQLTVSAGPAACSYCLVSKPTLRAIALDHLVKAGLAADVEIEITYPEDLEPEVPE